MKPLRYYTCVLLFNLPFLTSAQSWSAVSSGVNKFAEGFGIYNGELYAGGAFDSAGNVPANMVAKWDGNNWEPVGQGIKGLYINCFATFNGAIYAAGIFDTAGVAPAKNIASWNGTNWSATAFSMYENSNLAEIFSLAVFNGELYAAGSFDSINGIYASNIAKWDGINWTPVGGGIGNTSPFAATTVYAMTTYNNELYVGGVFDIAGGVQVKSIARWDGSNWDAVGNGINCSYTPQVNALCVYNNKLYAAGHFDTQCGNVGNNISGWDGSIWFALDQGISADVGDLAVYHNELIAAGLFSFANGILVHGIARWNDFSWNGLGSGISLGAGTNLMVYNDELYDGGHFEVAGGIPAKNIARWYAPSAISEIKPSDDVSVYVNLMEQRIYVFAKSSFSSYEFRDYTGKLLFMKNIIDSKFEIDLNNCSSGLYFLIVKQKGKQVQKKIVFQRH